MRLAVCKAIPGLIFSLLLSFFSAFPQTYSFNNYTVQDGLAQSNILGIVQDKNGYLWLGTESGASRFDGKNFRNYTTEDSLANNNISAMLLAKDGRILFGHGSGAITVYDGSKFSAISCDVFPKDKSVFAMFQAKDGRIWFSIMSYGLVVLKDPTGNLNDPGNYITYTDKDLGEQVTSICQDPAGTMWFNTRYGIKFLNTASGKFEYFQSSELSAFNATAFYIDSKGYFWLGHSYGFVYGFDTKNKKMESFTQENGLPGITISEGGGGNFINHIFEDSSGDIWFAAWDRGISRFKRKEKDPKKYFINYSTSNGLPINKVRCMAEDREGNILIGTFGNGLSIYKGERFTSLTVKDGMINNQVWGILQDKENKFWFGTNEGLSIFDPSAPSDKAFQNIKNIDNASSSSIRTIAIDKKGNIWLGTWGSKVIKYDAAGKRFTRSLPFNDGIFNYISCITVDSKNRVWIGTPVGLTMYDQSSGKSQSYSTVDGLSENDITCIFEDGKGNMWFGTKQKGVNRYDGSTFYFFGKEQGLTNGSITSIAESRNGKLWVGTAGGGVFTYSENLFSNYRTKEGLTSDYITLVVTDKNENIWIGTNNGLCKFDVQKKKFTAYGEMEGFSGVEAKANAKFLDSDGCLWFGTANGAFRLNPDMDLPNTHAPQLMIAGMKINNNPYALGNEMSLSYKENSITVEFIGISISNPDAVKYGVKLDGFDEDWKPWSRMNAETYSNLEPGNYTFNLKAINNSGVETETPLSFSFSISPPIWKTWWFYVLATILGVTILFAFIKIREKALIAEKKILETKVLERTAEVVEKNKELAEKNKDIMDSIHYAKRIQQVILPPDDFVRKFLPQTFILFKPKDIVSGDFYWLADKKDLVLFAAVDCTGHGVPGAFMSIVGHNMLEQIVNEHGITKPSEILEALNKSVSETLRQSYIDDHEVKDGMEAAVCMFNRKTNEFQFSGSMNPLYFIRKGILNEIKGDKLPIGNLKVGEQRKYTNHSLYLQKGDSLYIFSDGYADQFGGIHGKKFKYQQLKEVILKMQHLSMEEQGVLLDKTIVDWMRDLDQIDDILVIGTRL